MIPIVSGVWQSGTFNPNTAHWATAYSDKTFCGKEISDNWDKGWYTYINRGGLFADDCKGCALAIEKVIAYRLETV